jgi:hypothetical protein
MFFIVVVMMVFGNFGEINLRIYLIGMHFLLMTPTSIEFLLVGKVSKNTYVRERKQTTLDRS